MPAFKDITGQRFGKLTAIKVVERLGKRVVWRYQCDCGRVLDRVNESVAASVKRGNIPACSHCRFRSKPPLVEPRRLEIAGQTFGKLTAIKPTGRITRRRYAVWLFSCECGELVEKSASVVISQVEHGQKPNCGSRKCKRLVPGGQGRRRVINNYRNAARNRGIDFELSEEQMDDLFSRNCFYCGALPREGGNGFVYNGIDRVDNSKGYTTDNVVSCCYVCNKAKANMSVEEFVAWALRFAEHQKSKVEL